MAKLQNRPLESPRVIVCEGADEADILILLRREIQKTEADVEIVNAEGRQHLVAFCGDQLKASGGSSIRLMAVVLDSEDDLQQTQALIASIRTQVPNPVHVQFFRLPLLGRQLVYEAL